jgi:formamidopyrimidine-DNA glycosylase
MPELPEVETVRTGLSDLIVGQAISSVSWDWPKSFPNSQQDVEAFMYGATITAVRRRAKVLLIDLDTNYTLVIHLKMTGQMVYIGDGERFGAGHPNDSLINDLPDKSTRVSVVLSEGSLYFNDQRKFGWMRLIPTPEVMLLDFFKKVGPEPLSSDFTAHDFIDRIMRRKNSVIKAALLDQTVIAGVGNIYADESLWGAAIHPSSRVGAVPHERLIVLFNELQYVLRLAIEKGGSSDRNYINAEGKRGSYLQFARVFRREKLPCPRCGETIIKLRVAGRGTHICPKEQQLFVLP